MKKKPTVIAFIPARSGSKRIPNKNIKLLDRHPLLAYSINAALDSGVFDSVICATDSSEYADIAKYYGAEVPVLRKKNISGDHSPDIDWVKWILDFLAVKKKKKYDIFCILRPTSPFRKSETIIRAWKLFLKNQDADSLRAVEKCKTHPGKMWVIEDNRMTPLMPFKFGTTPWHSSQYASLPEIFSQDASLEISWTSNVIEKNSIAGQSIIPFISNNYEGFDLNQLEDWLLAEKLLSSNLASLQKIKKKPYHG